MATQIHPPGPRRQTNHRPLAGISPQSDCFPANVGARARRTSCISNSARKTILSIQQPGIYKDVLVTNNRKLRQESRFGDGKKFLGEGLLTSEGEFHRRHDGSRSRPFIRQRING